MKIQTIYRAILPIPEGLYNQGKIIFIIQAVRRENPLVKIKTHVGCYHIESEQEALIAPVYDRVEALLNQCLKNDSK